MRIRRDAEMEEQRKPVDPDAMRSSTGLEVNIAGLLCYLIPFLSGLLLLLLEKNSRFVKFHAMQDRKSTRLNSSHVKTSYAVLRLKKKTGPRDRPQPRPRRPD